MLYIHAHSLKINFLIFYFSMTKSLLLLFVTLFIIGFPANSFAQTSPPPKLRVGYEINLDTLKQQLSKNGLETTVYSIYAAPTARQIQSIENGYIKLDYAPQRVEAILDSVVRANSKDAATVIVEFSLGKRLKVKSISKPSTKFEGNLSPSAEKSIFGLQWNTKNRQPLTNLKQNKFFDFDAEMEQILLNEANGDKLVEEYMRSIDEQDKLSPKLGMAIEDYLLENLKEVLTKKNLTDLTRIMSVVDMYLD
jgi:hypothetical protein